MKKPWEAESTVSESLAKRLIEAQFPELAPVRAEQFGVGWDNTVMRVNDDYVFRFPRRQVAVGTLAVEAAALPRIAPSLPLAVPVPVYHGRPSEEFDWPFAGYRMLPGRTACGARLDAQQRSAVVEPLAGFLKTLHAVTVDAKLREAIGGDALGRLDLNKRIPMTERNLTKIVDLGLIRNADRGAAIMRRVRSFGPAASNTIVHGDLYVRHMLVDERNELCGVIDWGDAHVGDRAIDLSIVHTFLPPDEHGRFREIYGVIDSRTWELARFRALHHLTVTTLFAHETDDADLLYEDLLAFEHLWAGVHAHER